MLNRFQRNLTLSILDCGAFAVAMAGIETGVMRPTAQVGTIRHRSKRGALRSPAFDPRDHSYPAIQFQTLLPPVEALDEVRALSFPIDRSVERSRA